MFKKLAKANKTRLTNMIAQLIANLYHMHSENCGCRKINECGNFYAEEWRKIYPISIKIETLASMNIDGSYT